MKKIATLFLLVMFYQNIIAQVWTQKANYGGAARSLCSAFSIPALGQGYIVGGSDYGYLNDVWDYDTLSNTWSQVTNNYPGLPDAQVACNIDSFGYVGTGVSGGYQWDSTFWKFNPLTQTWTKLAHFPGVPRGYATGFALNGDVYIGGGSHGYNFNSSIDFYQYTPSTNTWARVADCPALGCNHCAVGFSLNGYGYVGLGSMLDSVGYTETPEQDFWQYDPVGNAWTKVADFPGGPRVGATAFVICNKAYVGCGYSDSSGQQVLHHDFWQYDPVSNSWTQVTSLSTFGRCFASAFSIGSFGYVGTGSVAVGPYENDFWNFHFVDTVAFSADSIVCAGHSVLFTDTSKFGPTSWQWQFPGGTPDTSSEQNPVVTYSIPGHYSVTLTASDNCFSGTTTKTQYIDVNPAPLAPVFPKDTSFCGQFNLTLSAGASQSGITYLWPATGDTSSAITVSALGKYWVIVSGSCDTVSSDTINVSVDTNTVLQVIPQSINVCAGQGVTLKVSGGGSNFTWSPTTGLSATTGDSVVANPTASTTYSVRGTDSIGCPGKDSGIVVTIIPSLNKPTITVSSTGDSLISSAGSYNQWFFNDQPIQNATGQVLVITGHQHGYYYVVVTNPANGCTTTSDSTTSINRLSAINDQLSIYPNPFNSTITVKINLSASDINQWSLQLIDVLGRILYYLPSLNYSNDINLPGLAAGMYFITVLNNTTRAVFPVVKQN